MENNKKIHKKRKSNKRKKSNKKRSKKFSGKSVILYIIFILVFTVISFPFTLLYGPFENAKKTYVGTAMGSMHYKWLATMFLSEDKIEQILAGNDTVETLQSEVANEDENLIEIPKKKDDSIELKEIEDENEKFKGYALIINDPTRVKIGVSSKLGKSGEAVSTIAENYDAVAAINGGYFTDESGAQKWTSNGGIHEGFLMSEGEIKQNVDGDVKQPIVALTKEGKLLIGETTTNELLAKKENDKDTVTEAMTYEVDLIRNGEPVPIKVEQGSAPRTMIGQRINGQIVLVVLDSALPGGRICASLKEARTVMMNLDCYNAINLDGGKSTTMYLNGEVINNPSYALGERPISAGFIVK